MIEQVLNGTHHVRSLRGIIILSEAIEKRILGRIFESLWKRKIFKYNIVK